MVNRRRKTEEITERERERRHAKERRDSDWTIVSPLVNLIHLLLLLHFRFVLPLDETVFVSLSIAASRKKRQTTSGRCCVKKLKKKCWESMEWKQAEQEYKDKGNESQWVIKEADCHQVKVGGRRE